MAEKLKTCKHGKQPRSARIGILWMIECVCRVRGILYSEIVKAKTEEDAVKEWNNRPAERELYEKISEGLKRLLSGMESIISKLKPLADKSLETVSEGWGCKTTEGTAELFRTLKKGSIVRFTYLDSFEGPDRDDREEADIGREFVSTYAPDSPGGDGDSVVMMWHFSARNDPDHCLYCRDDTDEIEIVRL